MVDLNTVTYKIGIEIECLLGTTKQFKWPRGAQRIDYGPFKDGMNRSLEHSGSSERVVLHGGAKTPSPNEWTLTEDGSIKEEKGQVPVEIVSPILEYGSSKGAPFRKKLPQIFDSVANFGIETNKSCALHVHLSPMSKPWDMSNLHKLGCCILFWEQAMETLYSHEYRQNTWAKANGVDNPNFRTRNLNLSDDLRYCFKQIFETKTAHEFIALMNPPQPNTVEYDRYYGGNFKNLEEKAEAKGTVEFRRPPGVTQSDICQNWVDLTLTFVTAATLIPNADHLFSQYPERDVAKLKCFLKKALPKGSSADGHFGNLFNDKRGRVDMNRIDNN